MLRKPFLHSEPFFTFLAMLHSIPSLSLPPLLLPPPDPTLPASVPRLTILVRPPTSHTPIDEPGIPPWSGSTPEVPPIPLRPVVYSKLRVLHATGAPPTATAASQASTDPSETPPQSFGDLKSFPMPPRARPRPAGGNQGRQANTSHTGLGHPARYSDPPAPAWPTELFRFQSSEPSVSTGLLRENQFGTEFS